MVIDAHEESQKKAEGKISETLFRLEADVFGKVTGVAFRAFASREAYRNNLVGTVENIGDSCVRVVAEGNRIALQSFVSRLNQGPKESEVTRVEVKWSPAQNKFTSFDVV